jgi:hypothetical protein
LLLQLRALARPTRESGGAATVAFVTVGAVDAASSVATVFTRPDDIIDDAAVG